MPLRYNYSFELELAMNRIVAGVRGEAIQQEFDQSLIPPR